MILVDLDVKILVRAQHVFKQSPDRRCPLEPAGLPAQDSTRRVKALYRIEVTPVQSFKEAARKLNQVGGRGLLSHSASLLCEAFGGSTGLVDVGVGRQSHEEAIGRPADGPSLPLMDWTIDADRTTLLVDHRKHDPIVKNDELFDLHAKLGEGAKPVVQEATNCRSAFVKVPLSPVKDRIRSKEAHYRVDVTRFTASKARRVSSTGSGVVDSSAITYPRSSARRSAAARASSMSL